MIWTPLTSPVLFDSNDLLLLFDSNHALPIASAIVHPVRWSSAAGHWASAYNTKAYNTKAYNIKVDNTKAYIIQEAAIQGHTLMRPY